MGDPDIVIYQHNYAKPLLDRAIQLTERYVSEHKLVLTGGMAIDLALRAKGAAIYSDDQLPDYDIISDRNLEHAHALAAILCEAKLPDINVINAVHITTVRVRMQRAVLLDATYVPPICYAKIPYLDVGHLRVVHPHYQFIDQRMSLSTLLADTGLSLNVFNRLIKDVERNSILRQYYPITATKATWKTRRVSVPLEYIRIDPSCVEQLGDDVFVYTGSTCISGYLAYAIMINQQSSETIPIEITDTTLSLEIPADMPLSLLAYNIDGPKKMLRAPDVYRPLLNLKPVSLREGDIEIADSYGSRVGCNRISLGPGLDVCVASVDFILKEFLRDRIYVSDEPYSSLYAELVQVVDKMRATSSPQMWWPALNCYGKDNLPEYRVFAVERLMNPTLANVLKPRNEFLQKEKCKIRNPEFPREHSHYFLIDGQLDPSMQHTNYKYIMREFDQFVAEHRAG